MNYNNSAMVGSLPNEILTHIATFFSPTDLKNCNSVCERLGATCSDYTLWRRFFVDVNTTSSPEGRLCHTSVVQNDKMYIFGGHITQPSSEYFHAVKNDMFEYDLKTREWREVPVEEETAPRRTEHTAVVYNNQMFVFGGYSGTGNGYENSVSVFDFPTGKWSQLTTQGETPSARSAHTAVVAGDSMYVFGGWNGIHCMNDLHELNLVTMTWTLVCADTSSAARLSGSANHRHSIFAHPDSANFNDHAGELPSARCSHGAVVCDSVPGVKGPVMYVFGGYAIEGANENPNKGYLNDLYEFHFETKKWHITKTWGMAPSPRSRFRMVSFLDSIYLFAGWNSAKHFSSLHRYCATNKQWTEITTNFADDGIGQFSMIEHQGIMYVFSGFSPVTGCRNNLFAYPLAPALIQQAR